MPAPEQLDDPNGSSNPIGTGPFTFVSWTPDKDLVLKRNENYWQKDADGQQLPYLDGVRFVPIPDDGARTASIQTGDIDMTHTTEIGSIDTFRSMAAAGQLQMVEQRGAAEVTFAQFNMLEPPFDDIRAREAAVHAIDQQKWIDVATQGENQAATSVFKPASKWYYDADYPSYDLDEAKRLVAEYEADKGPLEFSYSTLSTPVATQQGELIKSMLEEAGMKVTVKSTEASSFIVDGALGQYQMIQWGQFGSPDPDYEHVWWYSANASPVGQLALNFPRNKDPLVDEALNKARSTDDFETRKQAYIDLQKRFAADVPYAFLDYPTPVKVAQNKVRGMLQDTLPDGEPSIPMGGPGSFSLVTRADADVAGAVAQPSNALQRGQHVVGQLGPADEQVRQVGVDVVVDQRAAVDPAAVQARGLGHGDRCARVPFVLAAGVRVDVRLAPNHRHRLGSGRSHLDQLGLELLGQEGGRRRRPRPGHDQAWWTGVGEGHRLRRVAAEHLAGRGQRDGAGDGSAAHHEGDVDGPVAAGRLAELAGAVEGVDDPHPFGVEAGRIVLRLLRQNRVTRAVLGQRREQHLVRPPVAVVPDRLHVGGLPVLERAADLEQELAGSLGEIGGQRVVVRRRS